MNTIRQLFTVEYGDKRYESKSKLKKLRTGTPLVAAGGRNNGIIGRFEIPATKRHILAVIRTGAGSVGKAFYHGYPCEVNSDALVLTPRGDMSADEMLWYARQITCNRFRFSFGRKITPSRLEDMKVCAPGEAPLAFAPPSLSSIVDDIASQVSRMGLGAEPRDSIRDRRPSTVGQLFDIEYGNSYELCNLKLAKDGVNFVSRTAKNNGVAARVERTEEEPFPAGDITVALGGTVLETFVQPAPFYTGRDVAVLKSKVAMPIEVKLFCCLAIRLHKFRFSYGRQANKTLQTLAVPPLPSWVRSGEADNAKLRLVAELKRLISRDCDATR